MLVQRAEQDRRRVQLAAAPGRARLEQLGAGEADEEDRRLARIVGKVLDELDQRRLGPVHVLEHENQRGLARGRLEQLADRPERLLLRKLRGELTFGQLSQHLRERPERDRLAVRRAAAREDGRLAFDRGGELRGEPRLADARGAEDGEEVRSSLAHRPLERLRELCELLLPTDHLPVRTANRPLDDLPRPLVDHDLVGRGTLLKARGALDRVTREHVVVGDDDLAGRDRRANGEADPPVALELLVQRGDVVAELAHRPDRAQRVVLVHGRHAEDCGHRAGRKLLDGAAVSLEDAQDDLERTCHRPPERLGIAGRSMRDDLRDHDRDRLP